MKKRNGTIKVVAILLAIVLLAVGYAATTKNLSITGTAAAIVDDSNFVVEFTASEQTNLSYASTTTAASVTHSASGTAATINVSNFTAKGDTATVTYTIENKSTDLGATLAWDTETITGDTAYFTVEKSAMPTGTLAAGASTTVTVTVTLETTPLDAVSINITLPIIATAVEA